MVNARRIDSVLHREIPLLQAGIRRRELFRQRLLRDRRSVARQLFVDRDEIPDEIVRAIDDRENIPQHVSFAPLPPEVNPEINNERNLQAIPAGEESEEELKSTDGDSGSLSDDSTVVYDLDDHTVAIPPGLLRAWERNAEIRRSPVTQDRQVQIAFLPHPDSSASFSDYSTPNYFPVRPEEFKFDPIEISPIDESLADQEVNNILDYLNSEFLRTIDEMNDMYRMHI